VLIWSLAGDWDFMSYRVVNWLSAGALLLIAPVASATVAFEVARLLRKPRLYDQRRPGAIRAIVLSTALGALALGASIAVMTFADEDLSDLITIPAPALCAGLIPPLVLPRVRNGRCVRCGYDLAGVDAARCPECGAFRDE
jgi:hypothetical protein